MQGNFRRAIKAMSMLSIALLILAACGGGSSEGKVLRYAREVPSTTINYLVNEDGNSSQVISNFSEGLTTYDKDGRLTGGQAESWEHNGNVYTFKLREGLKWSDGRALTAHDFVFGWQTLATLKEAPYSYFMADLQNGSDVVKGDKPASELGVKALDDRTLEVTLEQDRVYMLEMLAHTTFLPLNEAFYKEVGADNYATSPETLLASGAFVLTEYSPTSEYTLEKNQHYWNAENIALDRVHTYVIKESATQDLMYENGELDLLLVPSNLYDKYVGNKELIDKPIARLYYFYLSGTTQTKSPLLDNADFRKAVGYAIDKQTLATSVFRDGTKALDYLIPTDFGDVNGESYRAFTGLGTDGTYKFDVDKAQEHLTRAKQTLGNTDLSFKISYMEREQDRRVFENIKSQIETNLPGVQVTIESIPGQTYFKELGKKETPSGYSGWAPDYDDIATYFQIFTSDNSLNFSNYSNLEYDRLYEEAQAEHNATRRAQLFQQAEQILVEDGVIVPIAQLGKRFMVKDNVKGFNFNSISPEVDFRFISVG